MSFGSRLEFFITFLNPSVDKGFYQDNKNNKLTMDWLNNLNIQGFLVGLFAFFLIGVFHPIVIKVERNFGKKVWPLFLIPGLVLTFISMLLKQTIISVGLGVLAFALFWSTIELFKQHKRVQERNNEIRSE